MSLVITQELSVDHPPGLPALLTSWKSWAKACSTCDVNVNLSPHSLACDCIMYSCSLKRSTRSRKAPSVVIAAGRSTAASSQCAYLADTASTPQMQSVWHPPWLDLSLTGLGPLDWPRLRRNRLGQLDLWLLAPARHKALPQPTPHASPEGWQ